MKQIRYGLLGAIAALLVLIFSVAQASELVSEVGSATAPIPSSLLTQGQIAYQAGQYAQAAQLWQQAADISESKSTPLERAKVLNHLAIAQQQLGAWEAAEGTLAQSFQQLAQTSSNPFFSELEATSTAIADSTSEATEPSFDEELSSKHQQRLLGQAFNTQGNLYFVQGKTEAALDSWQQAEVVYLQTGDEARRLGSQLNQSQALQSLGFYLRARTLLEQIQHHLENQPLPLQLMGLRHLGGMYWRIGELEASAQALQQAIAIAETLNDTEQLGATLISLGNTEQTQQLQEQALERYQQAASISMGETQFQANLNQLQLLTQLEQWSEAQVVVQPLLQQSRALPARRSVIYGYTHFADSLIQLAPHVTRPSSLVRLAAQLLSHGVQQAQDLGDIRAEAYALGYLGHVYERSDQLDTAQSLTQQALVLAEQTNASDIRYQWQWQLGRILKAQGDEMQARMAYQTAVEALQSLRRDLVAVQPDLQFSFREKVEPVYREFVDLLLKPQDAQSDSNPEDLRLARQVIESLQVAELNDFFRTACLQDQAVALEQVEQTETAVLYPIILRDRLSLILSLPGHPLRSYSTPVGQAQVEQTLNELRRSLEKPFTTPEGKQLGQQVYDWLIRPAETDLRENQIQTLTFVLDGALKNVPMAALYDGQQYLIENYSIALTPGLQLLAPQPLKIQNERTLVAGLTQARHGFSELIYVDEELEAIQAAVPSKVLVDQTFTRDALAQTVQTSDFPVIHLATHGQFSSNLEDTFVLAWDEPVSVTELSTLLRQRDRPDPIELLVLSACETAAGDSRAALGLAGLAVQAGARSTLASLWSLDDESGARFIETFYQALTVDNVSRAEALRQAQLSLLKDPNYRHPIHWASYILVGNWL